MDETLKIEFELKYLKILQEEQGGQRILLEAKPSAIVKAIGNYFYKTHSKDAEKVFKTLFPYFNFKIQAGKDIKDDEELKLKIQELINEL